MRRALSIALLFGFAWAMPAQAQTYPSRPIKMMIPLASGSAVDVAARIIAEKMGDILGQRFVIENEPGASGLIGTRAGARATPDGYTVLVLNDGVITMLPNMRSDAGYDPFKDFVPVTRLVGIEWVLVANPAFPAKTVSELIALAKEKPGGINFGSGGYGSPQHIAAEMFMRATNVQMTHVPYRGPTPAINDLVAGHVSVMFTALSTVTSLLPDGRLRVLASTTPKRLPQLAGAVPTMAESGVPGFNFVDLGGADGAAQDAAADRRQAQRRGARHPERPGGARPPGRARLRCRRRHAGRAHRLHASGIHPHRGPHPRREYS